MRLVALSFLLIAAVLSKSAAAQSSTPAELDLMPMPASVQAGAGELAITPAFAIRFEGYREARLDRAADRFRQHLFELTAISLAYSSADTEHPALIIHTEHASEKVQKPGEDEHYRLEVAASGARLTAANPLGVLRGLETLLQLVRATPGGFAAPAVTIDDKPRFPWRGMMLDACRHWMPVEVVKRNLDGMAAVKMNVLHWHLSENQGFRVESKKFPKLHEMGSDGLYYTQAEIQDVIEYARERGIRVMPEFDMPGHSTAWFVGYPELASAPGPYQIERNWGVFDPAMDPTRDSTYKFLDKFVEEMAALFPDPYFHIGGDEVNGKQWNANPKIQAFMKEHQLADDHDLQAYFNEKLQKIVAKHHKTMVGWDEVLHPDLPNDIVVQSWRGQKSLAAAAKQGYRGLLSYGYYLDLAWHTAEHYAVDPMTGDASALTPEEQTRILGGESCMWTEWVSPQTVDSRIWPSNAAIAERLWSPQSVNDAASMYRRLATESARLSWFGLTHQSDYLPMLTRIAGPQAQELRVLADVVEPVKGYRRGELEPDKSGQREPLNRLIDAARTDSAVGRTFNEAIDRIVSRQASAEDQAMVRSWLLEWQQNHARLQPAFSRTKMAAEVEPASLVLSELAAAGLAALDALQNGSRLPAGWKQQQAALLERAKQPNAEVLIVVEAGISRLVQSAPE